LTPRTRIPSSGGFDCARKTRSAPSSASDGVIVSGLKKPIAIGRDEIATLFHIGQTSQALSGVAYISGFAGALLSSFTGLMKNPNAGWLSFEGFTPMLPLFAFWIVHPAGRVASNAFVVAAVALPLIAWSATCAAPSSSN
jgi:hypothetical protein